MTQNPTANSHSNVDSEIDFLKDKKIGIEFFFFFLKRKYLDNFLVE